MKSPVKFGKPKRRTRLKDYLEYPIWISAEHIKEPGWERPVVSPKNDVSEAVLQHAKEICDCPIILFTVDGFNDHGIGQLQPDRKLTSLFFWVEGNWQELGDELDASQNLTLVAVPAILGRKNTRFLLKKGKLFATRVD